MFWWEWQNSTIHCLQQKSVGTILLEHVSRQLVYFFGYFCAFFRLYFGVAWLRSSIAFWQWQILVCCSANHCTTKHVIWNCFIIISWQLVCKNFFIRLFMQRRIFSSRLLLHFKNCCMNDNLPLNYSLSLKTSNRPFLNQLPLKNGRLFSNIIACNSIID